MFSPINKSAPSLTEAIPTPQNVVLSSQEGCLLLGGEWNRAGTHPLSFAALRLRDRDRRCSASPQTTPGSPGGKGKPIHIFSCRRDTERAVRWPYARLDGHGAGGPAHRFFLLGSGLNI